MDFNNIYNFSELLPVLTVPELAEFLGIGRSAAYNLVRSNQLEVLHIGHQIRIPRHAVLKYLGLPVTAQ